MGTLTGQDVRLPDHCEHKLPTSCRLTSLRNCCACADERAHSPTYTTYIDGVGLVPRGRRWDRYCWFCKEFWSNRVSATNLLPTQTRIPEVPDQSAFLQRWYEFHRGYRIVIKPDGREDRIAVLGEPWYDVSPGELPRTLDELRAGVQRSMADPVQHIEVERAVVDTGPSLDETFDQLLGEAEEEEEGVQLDTGAGPRSIEARNEPAFTQTIVERDPGAQRAQDGEQRDPGAERELLHEPTHSHIAGNVMQATGSRQIQTRRIAALRRELGRMRTGLERVSIALRELGETPETAQSTEELSQLDRSLADIVQRNQDSGPRSLEEAISEVRPEDRLQRATTWLQERRNERQNAERQIAELEAHSVRAQRHRMALESKAEDLRIDILQAQLQTERWRQEGRSAENFRRVFGTREDMDREDWVSPINQMFTRAYDRFRDAEQARRENRTPPIWGLPPPAPGRARAETPVSQPSLNHTRQGTRPNEGLTSRLAREQEDLAMQESLQQYYQDMIPSQRRDVDIETPNPQFDPYSVMDETATEETIRGFDRLTFRSNGEAEITPFSDLPSLDLDLARWRVPPDFPLDPANHPFIRETPPAYRATHAHPHHAEEERGLDADKTRPDPKSDGDMTVKLDCKVCYTQAADTACLPCGHLVMCRWCSEQHSPSLKHDRTTPADERAQCPVCRKVVKKKVRVRLG